MSIPTTAMSYAAALRLVCLPYAGGGSAVYYRWRPLVPAWMDVVPLTLPGHDGRLRETPCTDLRRLASTLADELWPILDRPYAILGCSMGAWLGFELTRELRRRGRELPIMLVVAANRPPGKASESRLHRLPDTELIAAMVERYDGIPPAVRSSPELLRLLLPGLRGDVQMIEAYEYVEELPLEVPIFAIGGTEDRAVSAAQLANWRRHTARDFTIRLFPGGHFFLFQGDQEGHSIAAESVREPSAALRTIVSRLENYLRNERREPRAPKP